MANSTAKNGGILAGAGCIFGLFPLIISVIAGLFGSNIGNTLHWYTLGTAPMGAIVVLIGLIMAIVGASKSTPSDFVSAKTSSGDQAETSTPETLADPAPAVLPPLPRGLARSVKLAYAIGFGVVLVSVVLRVTVFQAFSGILTLFDLVPAFFAGWFVLMAKKADDGLQFMRLYQSQLVVSIAGCVAGLYPLAFLSDNISMLSDTDIDQFQWGGTIITGIIPLIAAVASLIFAAVARAKYRASFAPNS